MEDQEEKPTVHVVKSRPGTFGLGTKLNSQPDSIKKDDDDAGQKKTTSKSTLEKLLLEEEKRQLTLARESTGSVIYDYDEAMTVPYSVEILENESVESTVTENVLQNDVSQNGGEESQVQESNLIAEDTGVVTKGVAEQISDEGNQFSYTSESYTLEVSNEEVEYVEQGDQSEAAAASSDDEKLLINPRLSDTKNSLEILQISLANSESTAIEDQENSECADSAQDNVPKKKVGFFRKLFGGSKKKTSE